MDIVHIRAKDSDELERILSEQRVQLEDLRFRVSARELKNVHEIRQTRRYIARILTVLGERRQMKSSGASPQARPRHQSAAASGERVVAL